MTSDVRQWIALGVALGNKRFRGMISVSDFSDDELRLVILSLLEGHNKPVMRWLEMLGIPMDEGFLAGLVKSLRDDADQKRSLLAIEELLSELRDRREERRIEEDKA